MRFTNAKVMADDLIDDVSGYEVKVEPAHPAIQYKFDRNTVIDKTAAPINIVLLFDASNSMVDRNKDGGQRLATAKTAAKSFIESLVTDDDFAPTIYLCTFNKNASCIKLTGTLKEMQDQIDAIEANQGTNIQAAVGAVPAGLDKNSTFMVILSDGEASVAEVDGTLYSSFTFTDGTASTRDNSKSIIKPATEAALESAKESVKALYAIRVGNAADQEKMISDVVDSGKVIDVEEASGLKDAFGVTASEIKKYATRAQIIAEKGKYVNFVADPEHEEVYSGTYTFKDETIGTKDVIIWDITDPETDKTNNEYDIVSPVVNFEVNTSAQELYRIANSETPDPQITIEPIEGSNAVRIKLDVTAYTILKYTQVENGQEIEKEVPIRAFVTLTAYEETVVPYTVKYVYYDDNQEEVELKDLAYGDTVLDGTKIAIKQPAVEGFIYAENNDFEPTVGVDNKNFVIVLEQIKHVVEFFVDEKLVDTQTVAHGGSAYAPKIELPNDYENETEIVTYSTTGWDKTEEELTNITEDLKVYATIDENIEKKEIKVKTYTVRFYLDNELVDTVSDVEEGASVEAPKITLPENSETETEKVTYSTEGWDKLAELESVTSDLDVYATIVKTVVKKEIIPEVKTYTVEFYLDEKLVETRSEVAEGSSVEAPEIKLPANEETATEIITYSTKGWDKTEELKSVTSDLKVYATIDKNVEKKEIIPEVKKYTVEFYIDGALVETKNDVEEGSAVVAPEIKLPANEETATEIITYSTKGWDKTEELKNVTSDLKVYATIDKNVEKKVIPTPIEKPAEPIIIYIPETTPTPIVTPEPTPEPTPIVTPEPTPEPTPEVVEEIETPEVPEGTPEEEEEIEEVEEVEEVEEEEDIEIEEIETPEGEPEEEDIEIDEIETPEGLPQTGTTSVVVFFGIGAACIIFGGALIIKIRRREDEM